jgi:hypothetical protein
VVVRANHGTRNASYGRGHCGDEHPCDETFDKSEANLDGS